MIRSEDELLGLIGVLYDAALDEALWPAALGAFRDGFDARGALFFVHDKTAGVNAFSASVGLDMARVEEFDRERAVVDPRVVWAASRRDWTALYDRIWYSESEMDREPYYAWLAGEGLRYVLAVPLVNDDGRLGMATVQRTRAQGHASRSEVRRMVSLTPHLQCAVQLSMRVRQLEARSQAGAASADAAPYGMVALGERGGVLFANAEARRLAAAGALRLSAEGLRAARAAEDARLQRLIAGAVATGLGLAGTAGGAMALARPGGRPLHVLVAPLPRATPLFALERPAAVVFVTDPERAPAPPAERLRALWGLTAAEARLALLLLEGGGLKDAAERLGVAEATARAQLAAVFRKTGARRQAELIRLLLGSVAGLAP